MILQGITGKMAREFLGRKATFKLTKVLFHWRGVGKAGGDGTAGGDPSAFI
jgi:hypothetical protein